MSAPHGYGIAMLLVLDVGNTNTVLGVFAKAAKDDGGASPHYKSIVANWRVATIATQTVDEYGVPFRNLFAMEKIEVSGIGGIVISSVVPPSTPPCARFACVISTPSRCSSSPVSRPACLCFMTIPPKSARTAS